MTGPAPTWSDFIAGWELFREPLLASAVAGIVLGYLSVFVVLKRMIFVSASVTQGAGLGVALAFFISIHWDVAFDPAWGAIAMSLAIAGALVPDPARLGMTRETMLGMVFAFTGGAAILVGSRISQEAHDIQAILFGTGVLVMPDDLTRLIRVAVVVLFFQLWWFRGLTFASFDPTAARVQKVPVRFLDAALLLSIGIGIGVSARALGALPVFALTTLPGTAAVLIARGRLHTTFLVAACFGAFAAVAGYVAAFFFEFPVGAAQTVVATLMVALTMPVRLVRRSPVLALVTAAAEIAILAMLWHIAHR